MIARTTTYHRPAARTSGAFNYRFVGDVMCPVTAPPRGTDFGGVQ